jgi:TolB protein
MNADGSGARKLTVAPAHTVPLNEYDPAWSRDGSKLAYEQGPLASAGQDNSTDIAVVNADGTNARDLTNTPGEYELWPKWSPVADIIAFTTSEGIWTMRSDGTDRKLIAGSADHGPTSWSPDGRRLLFTRGGQIWAMNGDGTGQAPIGITPLPPPHSCCPTWSPDGRRILFDSGDGLYVANRDGSDSSLITGPGPSAPDWQPIPGPKRSDYKNAAQFCKAERDFLGDAAFTKKYGGGANAYGKCVSGK